MDLLSFEEIDAIDNDETRDVPVPEWGKGRGVQVRRMSRAQFLDVRQRAMTIDDKGKPKLDQTLWETFMLVNGLAAPVVTEGKARQLMHKWSAPVGRIVEEIASFNKAADTEDVSEAEVAASAEEFRPESE